MTCPSPLKLFQYRHGTLQGAERDEIAVHVPKCANCTARLRRAEEEAKPTTPIPSMTSVSPSAAEEQATHALAGPTRLEPRNPFRGPNPFDEESVTQVKRTRGLDDQATPAPAPRNPSTTSMVRGTPVGRYLVVEPLGSGGLGDVYTAYDPELDRCVAIKVLRPQPSSEEDGDLASRFGSGRDRLMREGKALARLAHPNVVAVYDVGTFGDDVFIAMERVEGITLSRWYRDHSRTWSEIRDVFLGAGAGLVAAHDAGIVHRDFKPQNVIVDPDGRPRVLDFGLARSVQATEPSPPSSVAGFDPSRSSDSLDEAITMEGMVLGTPQFMAPEQFVDSELTGPESDQFAFCVALWLALYEQHPFEGDDVDTLIASLMADRRRALEDRRGVPAWLHRVLVRGLSRHPSERFPSMHELLYALQHDKRSRRRQWVVLGSVGLLSALGAGALAFLLRPAPTEEHLDEVEVIAGEARDAAARSNFVYPSAEDETRTTAYRKVLALEDLEGVVEPAAEARALELRHEFSSTLSHLGDRYFEREGGRPFAADYYAAALIFDPDNEHARDRTTLTPGEIGWLRERAARGEFSPSELAAAASLAVLAVEDEDERREQLVALYAGDQAPSATTNARLTTLLGDDEMKAISRRSARKARAPAPPEPQAASPEPEPEPERRPPPPPPPEPDESGEDDEPAPRRDPERAAALAAQGASAFERGQFDSSESLYHRALGYDRRNAAALGGLAELYFERGSYQKAVQFGARAVKVAPKRAKHRIVLGDAYFKTLAYQSARREYEKAKTLGHAQATRRLQQLDARLGQ